MIQRADSTSDAFSVSHVLHSVREALWKVPKSPLFPTAMLVLEEAREGRWALYREISRFSRDLVGRAVVLDGGAWGSGGLGPAALWTRQVVRGQGTCCVSVPQSRREYSHPIAATRTPTLPAPRYLQKRVRPVAPSLSPRSPSAPGRSLGCRSSDFPTLLSVPRLLGHPPKQPRPVNRRVALSAALPFSSCPTRDAVHLFSPGSISSLVLAIDSVPITLTLHLH